MKIPKYRSLSFRLTLWYILVMGLLIAAIGVFLFRSLKEELWEEVQQSLRAVAADVNNTWWQTHGVTWPDAISEAGKKHRELHPLIQVLKFPKRREDFPEDVFRSENVVGDFFMLSVETYYHAEKSNQPGYLYLTISQAGKDAYPLRVILFAARGPYIIQVGISLARSAGQLRRLTIGMVLAGLLLLFFASCGGFLIIRRALQPVSRVVTAAQQISTDDLSLRIAAGHRKDEIGALVETFNDMISRLEESVKRIKQFSGDVSHELRTPLTRIRGEVEVLLRHDRKKEEYVATMRSILEEIEIMGRIIEDLLFLSRVEAGKGINWSDQVDLSELLIRACGSRRTHAAEEKLVFSFNPFPGVFIKGDCALLERMLTNIIDNAIRYTAPGGRVDVSLEQEQGQVLLRVSDTGIGIPEAARPSIFDRFFVVDYSRSKESGGVGLGLAIAKSIADLHGAVIEVQSEVGRGSIFTIRFLRK